MHSLDRRKPRSIPVLLLQGSNDPWVPSQPALDQPRPASPPEQTDLQADPQAGVQAVIQAGVQVVVTRGGGHVGFHDRQLNWHIRATIAWCGALADAATR